jgi:poly(3-hydroxybutyrate) depolymerase
MKHRTLAFVALALALAPASALAQAETSLSSLRVRYNTQKNTVKPEGALKLQIDGVDRAIAEATRLGQTGEMRRLFAKGTALLAGREWTNAVDFANSLVLRTEMVVADSTESLAVRLEQIYRPAIVLERPLTAHARLLGRPAASGGTARQALVKELGTFDGVGRDLRDAPFLFELDVQGVPDGTYQLAVDVSDGDAPLGSAMLLVALRRGLNDEVARLGRAASQAPETLGAEILFPVDRMNNVNRGRLELRTFDPEADFPAAEQVASAVREGRDPFKGRTGDFKRHYRLDAAGEILPYRMYVPTAYDGTRAFPLIVALHGLGGTEDSFFTGYGAGFPTLAEQHGYIVAAPLGFRVDGSYGWGLGTPPTNPAVRRVQELSEADVIEVLTRVRQLYTIDASRIYLAGHSMGGIGTWKIAAKSPEVWAAIAPISGSGNPDTIETFRHIPEIVVHGDADPTVNVRGSRAMVQRMKTLGVEVTYIEVPGGTHSSVVGPNFPAIFDFFDRHRKPASD